MQMNGKLICKIILTDDQYW